MKERVSLSYCPTMLPYVEEIKKNLEEVEIIPGGSAAGVLSMLRNGNVDMIIIGRKAYERELTNEIKERRLQEGYTLAYSQKMGISEEKLKEISVKTYVDEKIVKEKFAMLKNVTYYEDKDECINSGVNIPMLVDWQDFKEEFELLIPLNNEGGKTSVFRAPVVYYNKNVDDKIIDKIEKILK
ncbi:hypothetical protein [Haliovirga abyssi]|uniref:Uncharacterized protein n=1 Tax=Haliovirga abyssi TaxID=2996794 RepID=A0AAU9DEG1_9FUSO|nr:hypothetical protein [Haliovirga abyssi]BDU49717.1 hypothetical protein HLVA_02860 [Haliovirga abyssi]